MNNKFHAIFRQGATVIVVIILAIAAFWLVGRQAQPATQPTAQDTDRPTPPPATPQPTIPPTPPVSDTATPRPQGTPLPTPSITPTPQSTVKRHTPEVSIATITLITPPPPSPTVGPGPLAGYTVEAEKRLAVNRKNQTVLAGWTTDGQRLFTYSLFNQDSISAQSEPDLQTSIVTLLPLNQGNVTNVQELPTLNLGALVGRDAKYPSEPIKQLGHLDYFIYRENLADNSFHLWLSNFDGSRRELLAETDAPSFAVSVDGVLIYIHQRQLHLVHPLLASPPNPGVSTFPLDRLSENITPDSFNLALSAGGHYVALYDQQGHFHLIDTTQQTALDLSPGNDMAVQEATWSPDGRLLAYTVGSKSGEFKSDGNTLFLQEANGANKQAIPYHFTASYDAVGFYDLSWSPQGEFLAAIASPYTQCEDCRDLLVLISRDGQHVAELKKMNFLGKINWSAAGDQLAYLCISEAYQSAQICVSNFVDGS